MATAGDSTFAVETFLGEGSLDTFLAEDIQALAGMASLHDLHKEMLSVPRV